MSGSFVCRRGRAALLASASGAAIGLVMGLGTVGAHAQTFYPQNGNVPDNQANSVTVANETNGAICDLLGGDDSVTVSNSMVTGATNCRALPTSPTPTTTGTVSPVISLGDGNDIFTLVDLGGGLPASIVNADISAGAGDDTVALTSGTVNGNVLGGAGNDTILLDGATVNGNLQGDAGNDRYDILSGLVNGGITDSSGNDIYNLAGGRITGSIHRSRWRQPCRYGCRVPAGRQHHSRSRLRHAQPRGRHHQRERERRRGSEHDHHLGRGDRRRSDGRRSSQR